MGIRYSLPLNDAITLRGRIGGRRRYWYGHHYYPAGPQSLTGAFVRYGLVYPMLAMLALAVGFIAAPIAGGAWMIRRQLQNKQRQMQAQRFPVQQPYGFVPAQRPVPAPAYAPTRRVVAR